MAKFSYGRASRRRLGSCHVDLQRIADMALSLGLMDITVVCGHRSQEEQDALYPEFTRVKYPHSKHNTNPSIAIDLAPYHPVYGYLSGSEEQIGKIAFKEKISLAEASSFIKSEYHRLAGIILTCAKHLGIDLRWGGDWDSDSNTLDQNFIDLPHFELTNPN